MLMAAEPSVEAVKVVILTVVERQIEGFTGSFIRSCFDSRETHDVLIIRNGY